MKPSLIPILIFLIYSTSYGVDLGQIYERESAANFSLSNLERIEDIRNVITGKNDLIKLANEYSKSSELWLEQWLSFLREITVDGKSISEIERIALNFVRVQKSNYLMISNLEQTILSRCDATSGRLSGKATALSTIEMSQANQLLNEMKDEIASIIETISITVKRSSKRSKRIFEALNPEIFLSKIRYSHTINGLENIENALARIDELIRFEITTEPSVIEIEKNSAEIHRHIVNLHQFTAYEKIARLETDCEETRSKLKISNYSPDVTKDTSSRLEQACHSAKKRILSLRQSYNSATIAADMHKTKIKRYESGCKSPSIESQCDLFVYLYFTS